MRAIGLAVICAIASTASTTAAFKKIILVDLDQVDARIPDQTLGGTGPTFRFPFQTIEALVVLGPNEIGVVNDNNYSFSHGRDPAKPDPSELIVIRLVAAPGRRNW